jgi:FKBP-type peptidyl-prolyl cis-trans isomerase
MILLVLVTVVLVLCIFTASYLFSSVESETQEEHHARTITKQQHQETSVTMGFTKTLLKAGNGIKPTRGQSVTVHCTGYGKNRDMKAQFWSTKDAGQEPFTFSVGLGQVIKAWDEAVIDMSIGEVAKIHASPDYAYGAGGFPAWGIMPNSELIFEIEVLSYK